MLTIHQMLTLHHTIILFILGIRMRIMPRARYVYNVHVIGKTQHEHVKGFD